MIYTLKKYYFINQISDFINLLILNTLKFNNLLSKYFF